MSRHEDFRRAIRDLNLIAQRDVRAAIRGLSDPRDGKAVLELVLPEIVDAYGDAASAVAVDYYDELREAERIPGRHRARAPRKEDTETAGLVRWALGNAASAETFVPLILGGLQARISNTARATVQESALRDPHAQGWMRIGNGGCDFCAMLVARGAVYSKQTVDFSAHDNCSCGAAPAWNPDQVSRTLRPYVDNAKGRSESTKSRENAAAREWIADNL